MKRCLLGLAVVVLGGGVAAAEPAPPNILLITADDLNCDSVGAFGGKVPGATPNIDRLASEGMRFARAHVTVAVCQPCRNALMTGRYPHRCGGEGFFHLRVPGVPILPDLLRKAGYTVGILSKVPHSTPYANFKWDMVHDNAGLQRNPDAYAKYTREFLASAKKQGKPFFLMANANDPHRPFLPTGKGEPKRAKQAQPAAASRLFEPSEVVVPGFLPDLPPVREEVAAYFGCVRRCDDTVGAVLKEFDDAGLRDRTLVMFLGDHGMAFPFAKTNCYLHSTRTPLIVRWPGVTKPGAVDADHFVGGIDLMPTLLEAAGVPPPEGMDGRSAVPLLRGEKQQGRERVFTQMHETAGRNKYPMRCVHDPRYGYIWNGWSDGETVFRNESQAGLTMKAMRAAAAKDPQIAARVKLFLYRVPEELYDYANDPDALHNLAGDPAHRETLRRLRGELLEWMKLTEDPQRGEYQTFLKDRG